MPDQPPPRPLLVAVLGALVLAFPPGCGGDSEEPALEFAGSWTAPGESRIDSVLAMPNGDVLGFVSGTDEQPPRLYRLDRDAKVVWLLELPGVGDYVRLALDPEDGAILCSPSSGLKRVADDGRIAWELGEGAALRAIRGLENCDAILPTADGILVLGRAADGPLKGPGRLQIAKVAVPGKLEWIAETSQALPRYAPVGMTLLPDGDVEVFARDWIGLEETAPWLRRLSPEGKWRPLSKMERAVPPTPEWGFLETVTLSGQRTILRVGQREDPGGAIKGEYGYCRFLLDEWSADGMEHLGEFEMNESPPMRFRFAQHWGFVTYLGQQNGRSFYLVECRLPSRFRVLDLAVLEPDRSWRWYWIGALEAEDLDLGPEAIFCLCYGPAEVSSIDFLSLPPELRR